MKRLLREVQLLIVFLCLMLGLFNAQAQAVITVDAATQAKSGPGAPSLTFTHPVGLVAATDRILWVGVQDDAGDTVTGIFYNGVPMTQAVKERESTFGHTVYLYYRIAPNPGIHDVFITRSGSTGVLLAMAVSYGGASQTGQPEATARNSHGPIQSTIRASVTTFTPNAWIVAMSFIDNQSEAPLPVGLINRQVLAQGFVFGDTNGPKTPNGVYEVGWDGTAGNQVQAMVAAAFVPAGELRVTCDIQMSQPSYRNGDQVVAQDLRVVNRDVAPVSVEVALWADGPGIPPVSFANLGAEGNVTLPVGFNQNVGPFPLFTVTPAFPRGTYGFYCRSVHPITKKLLTEDLNRFAIQ